jgi:hypothetical protein
MRGQLALPGLIAFSLSALSASALAQQGKPLSDAEYTRRALTAAPASVAKSASVVRPEQDGTMRSLRKGTNGFTCLIIHSDKMCGDKNSMDFFDAVMSHKTPSDRVGVAYMLAGDDGASNTDPYATAKTATNHWVVTGPHIMVVGPATKGLGLPETGDPDPKEPYMMWANTPYEHAMIPVK